jgi:hypothetical protein
MRSLTAIASNSRLKCVTPGRRVPAPNSLGKIRPIAWDDD